MSYCRPSRICTLAVFQASHVHPLTFQFQSWIVLLIASSMPLFRELGVSLLEIEDFMFESDALCVRIGDFWTIPDVMEHFAPEVHTFVHGLVVIKYSPVRSLSVPANEVLIVLHQLGLQFAPVETEGVVTGVTVGGWLLPPMEDPHFVASWSRITASLTRLGALLAPMLAEARAAAPGAGVLPGAGAEPDFEVLNGGGAPLPEVPGLDFRPAALRGPGADARAQELMEGGVPNVGAAPQASGEFISDKRVINCSQYKPPLRAYVPLLKRVK